jgi:hypothetical protein
VASYDFSVRANAKFSALDTGLNGLDDVKAALESAKKDAAAKHDTATVNAIDASLASRQTLQDQLTANFQNFEDFVQRPGKLREDLTTLSQTGIVTPAATDLEQRIGAEWSSGVRAFNAYLATLPALNATLKAGGYGEIAIPQPLK